MVIPIRINHTKKENSSYDDGKGCFFLSSIVCIITYGLSAFHQHQNHDT